jgi:hypothetical protein
VHRKEKRHIVAEQKLLCSPISERHERLWSAVRVGIQASKPWFPQVLALSLSLSLLSLLHTDTSSHHLIIMYTIMHTGLILGGFFFWGV